ncbi:hypothetical protein GOV09_05435 [Candidatus Woesearchaeota archaeon]|nr:hypothetical protein [Candidatus Woesearchaeota archaeon]
MKIRLLVKLKIPDTTCITAFHTLEKMGFKELKKLEREDFYEFEVLKDAEKFMKDIVQTDIVVNANKHSTSIYKVEDAPKHETFNAVVINKGDAPLFKTLREQLGFDNLHSMRQGVLWKMHVDSKETAEKILKDLLYSEHYQEYEFI